MSHAKTVQAIYEAFGRGDVPAILERLHPDVEWEHDLVEHGIPWIKARRGRQGVSQFFETVSSAVEFQRFEPTALLEGPGQVVATVQLEATVRATGHHIVDLEAHLFTFDAQGRVTRFRHFVDTHQHWIASRA